MGSTVFNTQYQNDVELMKGNIFREEWIRFYETEPEWERMHFFIGCDPAATRREALLTGGKTETDCVNMPILQKDFDQMARYGKSGQRAVLILYKDE